MVEILANMHLPIPVEDFVLRAEHDRQGHGLIQQVRTCTLAPWCFAPPCAPMQQV